MSTERSTSHRPLRIGLAGLFLGAAALHHARSDLFEALVPATLNEYRREVGIVTEAGLATIGTGFLVRPLRPIARWGATALLVGSLPEAVNQVREPDRMRSVGIPPVVAAGRIPLQLLVLSLAWAATEKSANEGTEL